MKHTCLFGIATLLLCGAAHAAEPPSGEQFDKLLTVIKPNKSETKWEQIPWTTDLWAARGQAAAQGKPILLWEMDGHPLGCT